MKLTEAKLKQMIIEIIQEEEKGVDSRQVIKNTLENLGASVTDENLPQVFAQFKDAYAKALGGEDSRDTNARNNELIKKVDSELNKQWKIASEKYKTFWDNFQFWHTLNFITKEGASSDLFKNLISGQKLPAPVSCWGGPGSDKGMSSSVIEILNKNTIMSDNIAVCLKGQPSMGSSQDINTEIYSSFESVDDVRKSADFSKLLSLDALIVGPNDELVADVVNEFVLYNAEFAGKIYLPYSLDGQKIKQFSNLMSKITSLSPYGLLMTFRTLEMSCRKPGAPESIFTMFDFPTPYRTLFALASGTSKNLESIGVDENLLNALQLMKADGEFEIFTRKMEDISTPLKDFFREVEKGQPEKILKKMFSRAHATNFYISLLDEVDPPEYQLYKKWSKIFKNTPALWKIWNPDDGLKKMFFNSNALGKRMVPRISTRASKQVIMDYLREGEFSIVSGDEARKVLDLLLKCDEEQKQLGNSEGLYSQKQNIADTKTFLSESKKIKLKIIT